MIKWGSVGAFGDLVKRVTGGAVGYLLKRENVG